MAPSTRATEQTSGLAKHRILVELGQGGMANVYLAAARGPGDFHKLVVLKVLRADLAREPAFREMALTEANIAARLNHPNVVQTFEVLNDDERPVIVMEYLDGQSLAAVLTRAGAALTLPMRLRILADALAGLHHAHELTDYSGRPFGLVHRDFTPQNIFLSYDGHVKLLDFGIAKTVVGQNDTNTGALNGKVRYMAPEQIIGEPPLDRRADIFAAGMVLWELLTGESPWEDQSDINVINKVINGEIPMLQSVAPHVPADLAAICTKAIAPEPDERYATAADMGSAIETAHERMSAHASGRDIARVVTAHFGDVRASTKRVIEERLARVEEGAIDTGIPILGLSTHSHVGVRGGSRPSRRRWFALPLGVALATIVWFVTRPHGDAAPPIANPVRVEVSTPVPTMVAVPSAVLGPVEIHVQANPTSAELFFDDAPMLANPAVVVRVADGSVHRVRAEARGYVSRTQEIVIDRRADLVLTLEPVQVKRPTHGTTTTTTTTSATPITTSPKPDCTPPYYVDDQGVKQFKPQCI